MTPQRIVIYSPAVACMGGWCAQRDRCARYTQSSRAHVIERMCRAGKERPVHVLPVLPLLPSMPSLQPLRHAPH